MAKQHGEIPCYNMAVNLGQYGELIIIELEFDYISYNMHIIVS